MAKYLVNVSYTLDGVRGVATVSASGGARTSITPLITPEEIDEAVKMHPDYRAPGA